MRISEFRVTVANPNATFPGRSAGGQITLSSPRKMNKFPRGRLLVLTRTTPSTPTHWANNRSGVAEA